GVSRSSALASKATGFPIAKIAALLAVGFTLDEIPNDITRATPACFEPALDYCVVKIPRWAFEKFRDADPILGTRMKSVGEVMAIGRTFPEALQKALRSLELDGKAAAAEEGEGAGRPEDEPGSLRELVRRPHWQRLQQLFAALAVEHSPAELAEATGIDPWFLHQMQRVTTIENEWRERASLAAVDAELVWRAKRMGVSDARLAALVGATEPQVRARRLELGI